MFGRIAVTVFVSMHGRFRGPRHSCPGLWLWDLRRGYRARCVGVQCAFAGALVCVQVGRLCWLARHEMSSRARQRTA
jgi:hypothetical protein